MRIFKEICIEILKLVEGYLLTTEKKFTSRFVIDELKGDLIEILEGSKVV